MDPLSWETYLKGKSLEVLHDFAKHVKEESWFDVDLTPLSKLLR